MVGGGGVPDLYDPELDTWSLAGTMATPLRAAHTATLLPSGGVLVIGGKSLNATTPSVELFGADLASGGWGSWQVTQSLPK